MPAAFVVTGPSVATARSTAAAFGFPDVAVVEVDTPLFGRTKSEIANLAVPAAVTAVRLLGP